MLPIYEALSVTKVISDKAGHTKPWIVTAKNSEGVKSFVVKLYSTEEVDQNHRVTNEVICNILAGEFDLSAPKCAFIDIPESLAITLIPENQSQFDNSDTRLKFATEYHKSAFDVLPELPKYAFKNKLQLDTLYGFDNLIRNSDRGFVKPNLLLDNKTAYLIDHERALSNNYIENTDIRHLDMADAFTKHHLFYPFLKKTKSKTKCNQFSDFTYYLENMNVNKLSSYFNQLKALGFVDNSELIIDWLMNVKQKSSTFVTKLKGSVI